MIQSKEQGKQGSIELNILVNGEWLTFTTDNATFKKNEKEISGPVPYTVNRIEMQVTVDGKQHTLVSPNAFGDHSNHHHITPPPPHHPHHHVGQANLLYKVEPVEELVSIKLAQP